MFPCGSSTCAMSVCLYILILNDVAILAIKKRIVTLELDIIIFFVFNQVKSERLAKDVGFKTRVTLGDILDVLRAWRKSSKTLFKARYPCSFSVLHPNLLNGYKNSSFLYIDYQCFFHFLIIITQVHSQIICIDLSSITQMTKLYAFIWNEMASSKKKTMEDLMSGPFIFTPHSSVNDHDDAVCGTFVYPNEVYWHDSTGSVKHMKEFHPQCSSSYSPLNKSLFNIYPSLRGFFVDECQVQEAPPLRSYIQIMLQLSTVTLPSQAADKVSSEL